MDFSENAHAIGSREIIIALGPLYAILKKAHRLNYHRRSVPIQKKEVNEVKTILIISSMILFLFCGQAFAQPIAKHLIDAKPPEALLFDAGKWFQDHPIKEGNAVSETIFLSPRAQVVFIRGKGMVLGRHIHTQVDELVYIYKGRGEYYINGKWVPAQAGQFHTCPRGVAHSSRAAEGEELWLICFFTDPLSPQGDRVMIDE